MRSFALEHTHLKRNLKLKQDRSEPCKSDKGGQIGLDLDGMGILIKIKNKRLFSKRLKINQGQINGHFGKIVLWRGVRKRQKNKGASFWTLIN
jgi:hypothetical protein